MKHLSTVSRAKDEIKFLQTFVFLAETYNAKTLQQKIIQSYAYTGSIQKTVLQVNLELADMGLLSIDATYVSDVIKEHPKDDLHRLIRTNYMKKTKHSRKKPREKGQYSY